MGTGRAEAELLSQLAVRSKLLKAEYHGYGCGTGISSLMGTLQLCFDWFIFLQLSISVLRSAISALAPHLQYPGILCLY